MNQDNNFNQNNFSSQGNNGISNNQPINNQSFNQNMNVNPQTTPGFQQPIMQEPIPQPTNTFDSGSANNLNLNAKLPKKMSFGLIIGIVATVLIFTIIGIFLLSGKESNSIFSLGVEKITSEDIDNYNLKSIARWGNIDLGVSYLIPEQHSASALNGSSTKILTGGHTFEYDAGFSICFQTPIEGSTNLETLPLDVQKKFSIPDFKEITLTEKVIIGDKETVYFESEEDSLSMLTGISIKNGKGKYLGYSFEYDGSYYSVYGKVGYFDEESKNEKETLLKKYLHYIINSVKKYNNESFYELDSDFNLKELFDNCTRNQTYGESKKQFVINVFSSHSNNGNFGARSYLFTMDKNLMNWNGNLDSIFDLIVYDEDKKANFDFIGDYEEFEILNSTTEKINGIEMKKYIIKYRNTLYESVDAAIIYTFIVDNKPYLFQYDNEGYLRKKEVNEQAVKKYVDHTDLIASTLIRTIRFVEDSSFDTLKKYCDFY